MLGLTSTKNKYCDQPAALELLRQHGDPVERRILQSIDQLRPVLEPYAVIWANHLLPRRDESDPWRVEMEWAAIAGAHYSALVQTYHSSRELIRILQICETFPAEGDYDPDAVLDLHNATNAFWRALGEATRFLDFVGQDAPLRQERRAEGLRRDWINERREQDDRQTLIEFYGRVPAMVRKGLYQKNYPRQWGKFLADVSGHWCDLASWLEQHDGERRAWEEQPA